MKRLKILFALLAVVFATASAFSPASKFTQSYFSYLGGGVTVPANYKEIPSDPGCTGANLCAIKVKIGANNLPDQTALNALYNESGHFANAGTFTDGIVELKP